MNVPPVLRVLPGIFLVYPKKTNLSLSKTNLLYRFLNDVANLKSYFKVLFDIYQKRIIS